MKELGLTEQEKKEVDTLVQAFGAAMLMIAISNNNEQQLEVLKDLRMQMISAIFETSSVGMRQLHCDVFNFLGNFIDCWCK